MYGGTKICPVATISLVIKIFNYFLLSIRILKGNFCTRIPLLVSLNSIIFIIIKHTVIAIVYHRLISLNIRPLSCKIFVFVFKFFFYTTQTDFFFSNSEYIFSHFSRSLSKITLSLLQV